MSVENVVDFLQRMNLMKAKRAVEAAVAALLADDGADLFDAYQRWEDGDFGRPAEPS